MPVSDGGENESSDSAMLEHSYDTDRTASLAVVEAIATLEDTDPIEFASEFGTKLNDSIDPTALDTLTGIGDGTGTVVVEFPFAGYRVRVDDSGRIRVFESL